MARENLHPKKRRPNAKPPSPLDMLLMFHRLVNPLPDIENRPTREQAVEALKLGLVAWAQDGEATHMAGSIARWCSRLDLPIPAWITAAGGRPPAPDEPEDDAYRGDPLGARIRARRRAAEVVPS